MTLSAFRKVAGFAAGLGCLLALMGGTAHAANAVGWVFADQPNAKAAYTPNPKYSFSSSKGSIKVTRDGTGYYFVDFGNLNVGPYDVMVSAYKSSGWCVLIGYDQVRARVACYDELGRPVNAAFTLLYQSRSASFGSASKGVAFLWADQPTNAGSYTPDSIGTFNSTGGTNTVRRNKTGNYTVTLPGLTRLGGNVEVTPFGTGRLTSRCKPVSWAVASGATSINVQCYNFFSAPHDLAFDLAYAVGVVPGTVPGMDTKGAWAWANDATSTTAYTPTLNHQYNGFATGHLTARKTGTGLYTVTIPGAPAYSKSIALVTATGGGSGYCNLVGWATATIKVACYKKGGIPADSPFEVAFQTAN